MALIRKDHKACVHCGTEEDTRPYGPGGSYICFSCMKSDPEREAEAEKQFDQRLENAGPVSVLTEDGPKRWPDGDA